ncbi:unnamed protein product [Prorocentrum cordatum]|uniref:Uncharacterized protein n=1 Tax=Prorocentrum cordatum TaxID=2364126 RepID=A0ABN9Q5K6_9DINO|nr:unnamed protein product [Polarella glacialis]
MRLHRLLGTSKRQSANGDTRSARRATKLDARTRGPRDERRPPSLAIQRAGPRLGRRHALTGSTGGGSRRQHNKKSGRPASEVPLSAQRPSTPAERDNKEEEEEEEEEKERGDHSVNFRADMLGLSGDARDMLGLSGDVRRSQSQ